MWLRSRHRPFSIHNAFNVNVCCSPSTDIYFIVIWLCRWFFSTDRQTTLAVWMKKKSKHGSNECENTLKWDECVHMQPPNTDGVFVENAFVPFYYKYLFFVFSQIKLLFIRSEVDILCNSTTIGWNNVEAQWPSDKIHILMLNGGSRVETESHTYHGMASCW